MDKMQDMNPQNGDKHEGMNMDHGGHGMQGMESHGGMDMAHMDMKGLKRRFWVSLALALPVVALSPMMGVSLPFTLAFAGSDWLVLLLCTAMYLYGGSFFLRGAAGELKNHKPAMMTLISLGITVAYLYSLYAFAHNKLVGGGHKMDFFWELATLIVIMLLGHWIEMRSIMGAGDALKSMAKLLPDEATLVDEKGGQRAVKLNSLQPGQTVLVKAGQRLPADGVIIAGRTSVDESLVTGEARAVQKAVGDKVIGGSQNGGGTVQVKVTGTGQSGYLAKVMALVGSAQGEKSRAETLSDRVAGWLFYFALCSGILAFVAWLLVSKSPDTALTYAVTVLVIACPHALGLAVPLVVARATSIAARSGLLLRKRQALETTPAVDLVAMDKTGTLTEGKFGVTYVKSFLREYNSTDILRMAAAVELGSGHPLAAGIVAKAKEKGPLPGAVANIQNLPGQGLAGTLAHGQKATVASAAYLDKQGADYDKALDGTMAGKGYSVSYLLLGGRAAGIIAQGDTQKPDAKTLIQGLQAAGIRPVMLTGDNKQAAEAVAKSLGVPEYHAALLPADKERLLKEYRSQGHTVMMVGDGVNDAPALARADVGVAIGAGTDVAIDSADVVLVNSEPKDILRLLALGRQTRRKMRQNLWWGAGYNLVAVPLAAGVLAPWGITLSPAVGALLMSVSTVIVALNALTLHIKK